MGSAFVTGERYRAWRYPHIPVRPLGLETRLDIRPKRFVVGLGEEEAWKEPLTARSAPMRRAFYLGRVEEAGRGDEVLATVWECPSGREALATLAVAQDFKGETPTPGSLLRIWTWVELPGHGECTEHREVRVKPPELSAEERQELRAFLDELETHPQEPEAGDA
jgi:hypothetical protein